MHEFIQIIDRNSYILQAFIENLVKGKSSFRYYDKRPISIIDNHIVTLLLRVENVYVAYGHLDKEEDDIWLGIAVGDSHTGKGYGNMMMEKLIQIGKEKKSERIYLTVDNDNINAINLYKKWGFMLQHENELYKRFVFEF